MAASLLIGGIEYISWLAKGSLTVTDDLSSNPNGLTFSLNSTNAAGATCPEPQDGAEVIYTTGAGVRLFGGVLTAPEQDPEGYRTVAYACTCTDYRTYVDSTRLNDRFPSMTAGAIVKALFAKYQPTFDTSLVNTTGGPTLPSVRFHRTDTITAALDKLGGYSGMQWDITPGGQVLFDLAGTIPAPFGLVDGGLNFSGLKVTIDRSQLANRITVKGGLYPASELTTDRRTGDGLTLDFNLTSQPYGPSQYVVLVESWTSFNSAVWAKADVVNPTPPAGHIGTDGYIFTTIQQGAVLAESGKLQVVGGDGTWGDSRVWGIVSQGRGDGGRRFEWDVYLDGATGSCRVGLWDPAATGTLAGEVHGVLFDGTTNTIKPSEGGTTKTPLNAVTYVPGAAPSHIVRVRIVPGAAAGAETWVNTDDANGFPGSSWVHLYSSAVGTLPNLTVAPVFNKDAVVRIGRIKVLNALYGITLTVGGVSKTVGMLGVDEDGGLDALVGLAAGSSPTLAFFGDTVPGAGAAIVISYHAGIPVLVTYDDPDSIAAVRVIENPANSPTGRTGIYEAYIEDSSIDSLQLAYLRGKQYADVYADALVTLSYTTYTSGLFAGQVQTVALSKAGGSDRDLAGKYLIQTVTTTSLGLDNYEYAITAGSRLKGLQELLVDLLKAGQTQDFSQLDDGSVLDQSMASSDTLDFIESWTIAPGPVAPYLYQPATVTVDTQAQMDQGTHSATRSRPAGTVEIAPWCANFSEWTLTGCTYDPTSDELRFSAYGQTAVSPYIPFSGTSDWCYSMQGWGTAASATFTPSDGWLLNMAYYDANFNSIYNLAGFSANGNAQSVPVGSWLRKDWAAPGWGGAGVAYVRITIKTDATYTSTSPKFRWPMFRPDTVTGRAYERYQPVGVYLTPWMDGGAGGAIALSATPPSLARATGAYRPDASASVAAGVPRYPKLAGSVALLVERATTNLFAAGAETFTMGTGGWVGQSGSSWPTTSGQLDPFGGSGAYRCVTTGGTSTVKMLLSPGATTNGQKYSDQVWIKVNTTVNATVTAQDAGGVGGLSKLVRASDGWQLVKLEGFPGAGNAHQLFIASPAAGSNLDVTLYRPMGETYQSCSTWHPPGASRAADVVSMPATGLDATSGKLRGRFMLARNVGTDFQAVFDAASTTTSGFLLFVSTAGKLSFYTGNAGGGASIVGTTTIAANTLYTFEITWGPGGTTLAINGTVEASSATVPTITFLPTWYLGCQQGTQRWLDGSIEFFELESSIGVVTRVMLDAQLAMLGDGVQWSSVTPAAVSVPTGTAIAYRYRSAFGAAGADPSAWSSSPAALRGRYTQVEATLTRSPDTLSTPALDRVDATAAPALYGMACYA